MHIPSKKPKGSTKQIELANCHWVWQPYSTCSRLSSQSVTWYQNTADQSPKLAGTPEHPCFDLPVTKARQMINCRRGCHQLKWGNIPQRLLCFLLWVCSSFQTICIWQNSFFSFQVLYYYSTLSSISRSLCGLKAQQSQTCVCIRLIMCKAS